MCSNCQRELQYQLQVFDQRVSRYMSTLHQTVEGKEDSPKTTPVLEGYAAVAASGPKIPKSYKSSLQGPGRSAWGAGSLGNHRSERDTSSIDDDEMKLISPEDGTDHGKEGQLIPKEQICFDFTKGQCRRGEGCKFSHDVGYIIRVNSQEKGICFDFLKGACRRGVLCRFSHDLNNLKPMLNRRDQEEGVGKQDIIGRVHGAGKKKSSICYDFVKNSCTKGDSCRYSHDYSALYNQVHKRKSQSTEQANPNIPAAQDCRSNSPSVICIDYLRGNCPQGMACTMTHVGRSPAAGAEVPAAAGVVTVPVSQHASTKPETLDDLIARLKKMQYEESIMKRREHAHTEQYSQYCGMSYPPPSMSQGSRLMDAYYNATHHQSQPAHPQIHAEVKYDAYENFPMSPPVTHAEKARVSLRSQLLQEQEGAQSPMIAAGWNIPMNVNREYCPPITGQQPVSPGQQSHDEDLHSFLTMQSIWSLEE